MTALSLKYLDTIISAGEINNPNTILAIQHLIREFQRITGFERYANLMDHELSKSEISVEAAWEKNR